MFSFPRRGVAYASLTRLLRVSYTSLTRLLRVLRGSSASRRMRSRVEVLSGFQSTLNRDTLLKEASVVPAYLGQALRSDAMQKREQGRAD